MPLSSVFYQNLATQSYKYCYPELIILLLSEKLFLTDIKMWSWSGCKSEQFNLQVRHPVGKLPHLQRNVLFWGKKQTKPIVYLFLYNHSHDSHFLQCSYSLLWGNFWPSFPICRAFCMTVSSNVLFELMEYYINYVRDFC